MSGRARVNWSVRLPKYLPHDPDLSQDFGQWLWPSSCAFPNWQVRELRSRRSGEPGGRGQYFLPTRPLPFPFFKVPLSV